jgi:hypothetical protein
VNDAEENQMVVNDLVMIGLELGFYSTQQLKSAIKKICHENPSDLVKGRALEKLYAKLIGKDISDLSEFDWLFGGFKSLLEDLVPEFLKEADRICENVVDWIIENQYWSSDKFFGDLQMSEVIQKLSKLDLLGYLPHIEVVHKTLASENDQYIQSLNQNSPSPARQLHQFWHFF